MGGRGDEAGYGQTVPKCAALRGAFRCCHSPIACASSPVNIHTGPPAFIGKHERYCKSALVMEVRMFFRAFTVAYKLCMEQD
ncbi:hypothetical protein J6590_017525 [Homalodisca vitripennis]|nr:hypothetical protein J6590_017525 [Homalodisca vitripennis]